MLILHTCAINSTNAECILNGDLCAAVIKFADVFKEDRFFLVVFNCIVKMANSENVDMMGLGQNCSIKSCNRLDFLPFKCSKCGETFW